MVYLGAGAILAVVVLIVGIGLFVTSFLPPRAHIVTIEDQSYNAAAVVARGNFLITFERQNDLLGDVAAATIDVLIFEETLRLRGPALVGLISEALIDAQLQELLGFDPLASTITPIPDTDDTADDAATDGDDDTSDDAATDGDDGGEDAAPEVTPTPRDDLFPIPAVAPRTLSESETNDFAVALGAMLSTTGLSMGAFRDIAEARVVRLLLNRYFDEELGASGEQLRLSRFSVSTQAEAEELRQRALDGESFEDLVLEVDPAALAGADDIPGDLGWFPRDLLPDEIAEALVDVEVGGLSEVVDRGLSFEVFLISEREPERVWEDAARQLLVRDLVSDWEEAESSQLAVEIGLSNGEEIWIIERVVSHVSGQVGALPLGGQ